MALNFEKNGKRKLIYSRVGFGNFTFKRDGWKDRLTSYLTPWWPQIDRSRISVLLNNQNEITWPVDKGHWKWTEGLVARLAVILTLNINCILLFLASFMKPIWLYYLNDTIKSWNMAHRIRSISYGKLYIRSWTIMVRLRLILVWSDYPVQRPTSFGQKDMKLNQRKEQLSETSVSLSKNVQR